MQKLFSPDIQKLIEALRNLPGVGTKTAQRMTIQLLDKNQEGAKNIAQSIIGALNTVKHCRCCQMLTDCELCTICESERRDSQQLCIVETMLDMLAIENAAIYQGKYFILHGRISPLDGMGPNELKLPLLEQLVRDNEVTAHFISQMLKRQHCKISRIGFGVPFGGELEYLDQQTLSHAFNAKTHL